ncbi:MAG: type III-A CRISPR-associated protein Cas10/Csm1, partial [Candidatus Fervidibacter sp.]
MAALSTGSPLLGILRMDVDNLGAIFAVGIEPRSPSRVTELSGRMDIFFSGWLRERCRLLTQNWQNELPDDDERKDLVDNAFYLVYAGGDDLMFIGPWDLTLWLALNIHDGFSRYCGANLNMTISAGIIFVKPKFPIHRFAVLAGEALERSKRLGRNRITAFNTTVSWDDYKSELDFGRKLQDAVDEGEMPRTFLHFLWRLYRTHIGDDHDDPMWVPLLHYMVARRFKPEKVEQLNLLEHIPKLIGQKALPIVLGYAILAT